MAYKCGCITTMCTINRTRGETEMKSSGSVLLQILVVKLLVVACVAQDYDFFYFVQQWPGSYCDSDGGCCYPSTGKPATNFTIHGLWPNYDDGSYPSYCDSSYTFRMRQVLDLVPSLQLSWPSLECGSTDEDFWSHEWDKHGTCSALDEHQYFAAGLNLKSQMNLLAILEAAGIYPDGSSYSVDSITAAITWATGFVPGLDCNTDTNGNSQLYEIYQCVDVSGTSFIECPILPSNSCKTKVEFPSFSLFTGK